MAMAAARVTGHERRLQRGAGAAGGGAMATAELEGSALLHCACMWCELTEKSGFACATHPTPSG